MRTYIIHRVSEQVCLCGDPSGQWAAADVAEIDNYPWYSAGGKQSTEARLLYDAQAIYAQFRCEDEHIFARTTELNGPVCEDSCVELFVSVEPEAGPDYFNLEINCCGTVLMGFGPGRGERRRITPEPASGIRVVTSIAEATKEESSADAGWWVATRVPFDVLGRFVGLEVKPQAADLWRGNFYRCGGKTDPQHACWNSIEAPRPDFHRPEFFGQLRFA